MPLPPGATASGMENSKNPFLPLQRDSEAEDIDMDDSTDVPNTHATVQEPRTAPTPPPRPPTQPPPSVEDSASGMVHAPLSHNKIRLIPVKAILAGTRV